MTETEALEKIRNYILNGDHSDGIIAPILNWCDEALESPNTGEAREIHMIQTTNSLRMRRMTHGSASGF